MINAPVGKSFFFIHIKATIKIFDAFPVTRQELAALQV